MNGDSKGILRRVNHLGVGDSSRHIYDDWSQDYDAHLIDDFGYISPAVTAQALSEHSGTSDLPVIDYGCGTGLVGIALKNQGFDPVDGLDISTGMLQQARDKGVYRNLICADLTARIALQDDSYGAGVCVGSMGAGHVGATQVPELLRPIERGGVFIVVINGMHYGPEGFEQAFAEMQNDGLWRILRLEQFNYMTRLERPGWLLVAEKS